MAGLGRLDRVADLGSAIAGAVENVRSMSRDTEVIERHAARLELIDERLERIDASVERVAGLMEEMVRSMKELAETVEALQESMEPVGRLAGRFPGRGKNRQGEPE